MDNYLDIISKDYESAEITCLLLHSRSSSEWYNLLTIVELIPSEQEISPLIFGKDETICADRHNVDSEYTIYLTRIINCPVQDAVEIYNNPEKGFILRQGNMLDCTVSLFEKAFLEVEPPSGFPLIIDKQSEHTIGNILPHRHTDFRVFPKIDRAKKWLSAFNKKQTNKIISKSGLLCVQHLGFDLSRMPEHLGNIYLCCCNPYLRKYEYSLLDYNKDLLITFYERQGKTIIGKKLVLEDKRAGNIGFSIEKKIEALYERIELPHFPDQLITKLYDDNGYILEKHLGAWINMEFNMQIQTAELNLTVKENDKEQIYTIPKFASERPVKVGNYDHSLTYFLKNQQRNKQIEQLEKNKDFIFFTGGSEDKEKSKNIIGELLNRASKRCMLLDPYFGAGDLFYAYIIKNISVPIQVLSSANFLKMKIDVPDGTKISSGMLLGKALEDYKKHFPMQRIECRVLRGEKSPLHDRYIIVNDTVYLLGSSFNEFGTRATTLFKVPAPEPMIEKAVEWWNDSSKSVLLSDFLN
jgi:hypothetical protein